MAINLVLHLDLSVDDDPNDGDNSSGRKFLSDYVAKAFDESPNNNLLDRKYLMPRGTQTEWSPDISKRFTFHAKHPIALPAPSQTAITYERREYFVAGTATRSRFGIDIPVVSKIDIALVAHLLVDEALSAPQRDKLAEGLRGFSQDPADDLQRYVVQFVADNEDVFGAEFSHESYMIDVGCILTKTAETVRDEAVSDLVSAAAQRLRIQGGRPNSLRVQEFSPRRNRKRLAQPTGPLYDDGDAVVEDREWSGDGSPSPDTLGDLDERIAAAFDDFLEEERQILDGQGCTAVSSRKEQREIATLLSWPQFKVVWERVSIRVGCVTVHIRVPKLKRRTAFKKLYVALAVHFELEDWLWAVLINCAVQSAVGSAVLGLITANPAVALAAFEAQFKGCVYERLRREVFACLSETIFVGTVHSGWKAV